MTISQDEEKAQGYIDAAPCWRSSMESRCWRFVFAAVLFVALLPTAPGSSFAQELSPDDEAWIVEIVQQATRTLQDAEGNITGADYLLLVEGLSPCLGLGLQAGLTRGVALSSCGEILPSRVRPDWRSDITGMVALIGGRLVEAADQPDASFTRDDVLIMTIELTNCLDGQASIGRDRDGAVGICVAQATGLLFGLGEPVAPPAAPAAGRYVAETTYRGETSSPNTGQGWLVPNMVVNSFQVQLTMSRSGPLGDCAAGLAYDRCLTAGSFSIDLRGPNPDPNSCSQIQRTTYISTQATGGAVGPVGSVTFVLTQTNYFRPGCSNAPLELAGLNQVFELAIADTGDLTLCRQTGIFDPEARRQACFANPFAFVPAVRS